MHFTNSVFFQEDEPKLYCLKIPVAENGPTKEETTELDSLYFVSRNYNDFPGNHPVFFSSLNLDFHEIELDKQIAIPGTRQSWCGPSLGPRDCSGCV